MSDDTAKSAAPEAGATASPRLMLVGQFIRDLSFENPHGPLGQGEGDARPQVEVQINVESRRSEDSRERYEVALKINAAAKKGGATSFLLELDFRGLFDVVGFPDNLLPQVLLVECPRLLFPFARRIAADAVRDGGFPALMIDPIDFLSLFRQRLAEEQKRRATAEAPAPATNGGSQA